MEGKILIEQVALISDAIKREKKETGLSYEKLAAKMDRIEEENFVVDSRYLARFANGEYMDRFLQRLWVLIRCAEHTGIQLDFVATSAETISQDKLRRIQEILDE